MIHSVLIQVCDPVYLGACMSNGRLPPGPKDKSAAPFVPSDSQHLWSPLFSKVCVL